jgi:hypothetical protein
MLEGFGDILSMLISALALGYLVYEITWAYGERSARTMRGQSRAR